MECLSGVYEVEVQNSCLVVGSNKAMREMRQSWLGCERGWVGLRVVTGVQSDLRLMSV